MQKQGIVSDQETALLLTADKDCGEMLFRQRLHMHGVVLIPLTGLTPAQKVEIVAMAVKEHLAELPRSFAVTTPGIFRIRRVSE